VAESIPRARTSRGARSATTIGMEPQPHQMPLPLGFRVILECRAVVQDPAVVDEIHVTRLEGELGAYLGRRGDLVECVERPDLLGVKRHAGFLLPDFNPVTQVTAKHFAAIPGQNGTAHGRLLTRSHTAAAIHVKRLIQTLKYPPISLQ